MLQLGLFNNKPFSSAIGAAGMGFVASGAHIYVMPFYLQLLLNFSPQYAGRIMLRVTSCLVLFAAFISVMRGENKPAEVADHRNNR